MTLDERMRSAAVETRSAVSARPRPSMERIARRHLVQRIAAAATAAIVVLIMVGVAGLAFRGPGLVAEPPPVTTTPTTVATSPLVPTTMIATPATTEPPSSTTTTAVGDDGLSDRSAAPPGMLDDAPAGSHFVLLDSGIAFAAAPSSSEGAWWLFTSHDARYQVVHRFGVDQEDPDVLPAAFVELAIDETAGDLVVAGIVPLDTATVAIRIGSADPVPIERVFDRAGLDRTVFVGELDLSLLDQESPIRVELSATLTDGSHVVFDDIEWQGMSTTVDHSSRFTEELFVIPPPPIAASIEAPQPPQVLTCPVPPGTPASPNVGGDLSDAVAFPSSREALEWILDGELGEPQYPQGGFVEVTLPRGDVSYAVPFGDDLENGAVLRVDVMRTAEGWTVASWEGSGC